MHRQDNPARRSIGDHHRRPRTVGSLSDGNRDHRQRRHQPSPSGRHDGGRPRPSDDRSVRPAGAGRRPRCGASRTARGARRDPAGTSRGVSATGRLPHRRGRTARSDHFTGENGAAGAARRVGAGLHRRLLERGEPDPRPVGAARRRAGHPCGAGRQRRRAPPDAARGKPAAVRGGCDAGRPRRATDGRRPGAIRGAVFGARAGRHRRCESALGRRRPGGGGGRPAGIRAAPAVGRCVERARSVERQRADHIRHQPPVARVCGDADRGVVRAARRRRDAADDAVRAAARRRPASRCATCWR